MLVAIPCRFAAANDQIELILETSKKSISESIEKLRIHEKIMRNYVDLHERATFSPRGSYEDKFLADLLKFIIKMGSEQKFPNTATASYTID